MKYEILKKGRVKIRNTFKKYFNYLLFMMVIMIISCNVINPIVTVVNNSDCDISNIVLEFVNPRIIEENGRRFEASGKVKNDIYLKSGQEALFQDEPALYGSIKYDCICNEKKETFTKTFTPFIPEFHVKTINYLYVDCDKNSKAKIEIK